MLVGICPKCGSQDSLYVERDIWGDWINCMICGYDKPVESGQDTALQEKPVKLKRIPMTHKILLG